MIYGHDVFNATRIDTEGMFNFYNQTTKVLKRWKISGQQTDIPKAIAGNTSNSLISSRFIEDGSYLRVKSVVLGYNLPASLLNKIKIKEKMVADAKNEAQVQGQKMIEQAKAAIESEKNTAMAELKLQVSTLSIEIAEKLLQEELSNKATQVKLVEKMLGDAKLS